MKSFAPFLFFIIHARSQLFFVSEQKVVQIKHILLQYPFEIILFLLILISFLKYRKGKKQNKSIVQNWVQNFLTEHSDHFKHIGVTNKSDGLIIAEDSAHTFKFMASQRKNLKYLVTTFELKKRQDIFYLLSYNLLFPLQDEIFIDIVLDLPDTLLLVFCIAKRLETKSLLDKFPDLKGLTRKRITKDLGKNFYIFSENEEQENFFLDKYLITAVQKYPKNFKYIYVSDQNFIFKEPSVLRICYKSTQNQEIDSFYMQLGLDLTDKIHVMKISAQTRINSEKERELFKEKLEKEKNQSNNQKKEQKMTKEQIKKIEEREQKKIQKKKYPTKIFK